MGVKAVVFDLDGTLATFNIDYMAVRAEVRGFLIIVGIPASVLSLNESIFEMLKKAEIFLKNNDKPQKTVENVRRKALAIAEKYELEAAKSTSLLPGVVETLRTIKKMGLKIGLCTINGEKSASFILKRFRILGYFKAIVTRDKVRYVKPDVEHLSKVLRTLRVKPQETILVGDGKSDMNCAKELKVIGVGFPTGISSPTELISSGASYIITSMADLPTMIEYVNKAS